MLVMHRYKRESITQDPLFGNARREMGESLIYTPRLIARVEVSAWGDSSSRSVQLQQVITRSVITTMIMSNIVPESAIEDSPPPRSEAGPSNQKNRIQDSFQDLDLDAFDWNAYEGTYKGQLPLCTT